MTVRITNGREVSDDSTNVSGLIDEDILLARQPGYSVHLFTRIALKPEMIQTRINFVLHHHQDEQGVIT